ncbi:Transmembrane protein 120A [Dissostichus eleginoides]|uniref:Transmembrane protein 120A n=1 Tax=Dissostichus eleginoides TaxID=100907 RepID=A0AAD9CFU5_DISEL|nr:Transmembrane protein 120A [Dissostichus eleginoides]
MSLKVCLDEWECLEEDHKQLQETHRMYLQKLDEVSKLQKNCSSSISRQRNRLKEVSSLVKRFAYKDEYERFKLYLTVILLLFSLFLDAILNFVLVWYYCTLTIRESILITNGSRPEGDLYKTFRNQFLAYSLYQSFVQCLQCYYQSGCLYRLRALGERHIMDLTVEGFQSWMWKGLTFLLPFLFFGHFWQLFNSLSLFRMARLPDCKEWQVMVCGLCFLILFMGNFFTTVAVVRHKVKSRSQKTKSL